jgi:hypothetical protein
MIQVVRLNLFLSLRTHYLRPERANLPGLCLILRGQPSYTNQFLLNDGELHPQTYMGKLYSIPYKFWQPRNHICKDPTTCGRKLLRVPSPNFAQCQRRNLHVALAVTPI